MCDYIFGSEAFDPPGHAVQGPKIHTVAVQSGRRRGRGTAFVLEVKKDAGLMPNIKTISTYFYFHNSPDSLTLFKNRLVYTNIEAWGGGRGGDKQNHTKWSTQSTTKSTCIKEWVCLCALHRLPQILLFFFLFFF